MARYIDADKLWNDRPQIPPNKSMDYGAGFSECMWGFSKRIKEQIDNPTTADVAPRAEVEQIFAEIEKFRNRTPFGYICFSIEEFEEIKKKYAEGRNERDDKKIV